MFDIVLFADDPAGAFSPALNASKPTGGTEVHMAQLAGGLAAPVWQDGQGCVLQGLKLETPGLSVVAVSDFEDRMTPTDTDGGHYIPLSRLGPNWRSRALITAGLTKPPSWLTTDRHVVLWTHDPPHNLPHLEAAGLRWSEFVCVSQWQAERFTRGWKTRVIPPIIDDWIYELPPIERNPGKFVCVSAWWKGTAQTLEAWSQLRPEGAELVVGSPYSHPAHARAMVERTPGCRWVDLASPRAVVEEMRDAAGVFRVNVAPETFGVTDAIAQILGTRVHCWAVNGLGGAPEALTPSPWFTTDGDQFASEFRKAYHAPPNVGFDVVGRDFRASRIIPMWRELLDL